MRDDRGKYLEHLRGDYWREVRRAVARRAKYRCERCDQQIGMRGDGHHLSYWALYREMEDLDSVQYLCRDCHDYVHGHSDVDPCVAPTQAQLDALIRRTFAQFQGCR